LSHPADYIINDADIPTKRKKKKNVISKPNPEDKYRGLAVARFKETYINKKREQSVDLPEIDYNLFEDKDVEKRAFGVKFFKDKPYGVQDGGDLTTS